ncbi:NADH-cytochrome b5 reductase-like [Choristoneura fumiferana]|uniref:NADH-cytochrome b5 reductase-like n=1 Tax=Choristoneura fumiferana TaxID=7141 RepID=UPI003D15D694
MKEPIEPSKEDCCNSGCNPCVFDVYEKQMKLYEAYIKNGSEAAVVEQNAISQLEYTSFKVVDNIDLCPAHKLIAFKRCNISSGKVLWTAGDHFLVKYNSAELVCTRAYTPIKYSVRKFDFDFEIVVKKYENGIVSDYLYNLEVGEETLWRGPYGIYEHVPNKYIRIIMIAQGTGIAPLYSIIQNIVNNEDDFTKIVLYFCCPSQETILFRDDLYSFQSYWNFKYSVFLSCSSVCDCKYQEPIKCRRLQHEDVKSLNISSTNDQFLLCGSSSFMDELKNMLCAEHFTSDNIVMF